MYLTILIFLYGKMTSKWHECYGCNVSLITIISERLHIDQQMKMTAKLELSVKEVVVEESYGRTTPLCPKTNKLGTRDVSGSQFAT